MGWDMKIYSLSLSLLAGACALAMPAVSQAYNIGYYNMCSSTAPNAAHAAAITAAGHTPILVATPDASSLTGLSALSVTNCDNVIYSSGWTSNLAAITAEVNRGMVLIMHDRAVTGAGSVLPGGAGLNTIRDLDNGAADIDFPNGSPITRGPGGSLLDTSLDNGSKSSHGYITGASIPAGGSILASRPIVGNGFTSCADQGYTGTKLNWCRQICEIEQRPGMLDTWIHRWLGRYHTDPPCGGTTPASQMEGATIWYPLSRGMVIYSTIPLDYYLGGGGENPPRDIFNTVYMPNLLSWAIVRQEEQ